MLSDDSIREMARAAMAPGSVLDARVMVTVDPSGDEMLDLTLIVGRETMQDLLRRDQPHDQGVLGVKSRLWRALREAGEPRFALIQFESEDEQDSDGDPES